MRKKYLLIVYLVAFLLLITGCNKNNNGVNSNVVEMKTKNSSLGINATLQYDKLSHFSDFKLDDSTDSDIPIITFVNNVQAIEYHLIVLSMPKEDYENYVKNNEDGEFFRNIEYDNYSGYANCIDENICSGKVILKDEGEVLYFLNIELFSLNEREDVNKYILNQFMDREFANIINSLVIEELPKEE